LKETAGRNKLRYPARIKCQFIDDEFKEDEIAYRRYAEADKDHTMINQGIG